MATSPLLPELSFEQFDGVATDCVWVEVAGVFQKAFATAPYFEDPVELAEIVKWGPARLASGGGRLAVARCEERIVGFGLAHGLSGDADWGSTLRYLDSADARVAGMFSIPEGTVVVGELAVDPEYRGRGAAGECLAMVLGGRHESRVVLGVFEQAEVARSMYARWGFEDLGTAQVRDGAAAMHVLTAESARLTLPSHNNESRSSAPVGVSYVIMRRGSQILLQLRQGTGYMDGRWATAAAGHVEAGELPAEAAVREGREELGITIAVGNLVPLTTMYRTQTPTAAGDSRIDHFFTCDAWSGTPRIMEPEKNAALKWFNLDDLPAALVHHERYVLERMRSGLPATFPYGHEPAATP